MDYRLVSKDGTDIGGVMPLTAAMQNNGTEPLWAGYVGVDDVDVSAETIANAGGKVRMGPRDIPDVGRSAMVDDHEGASFSIMQAGPHQEHNDMMSISVTTEDQAETDRLWDA